MAYFVKVETRQFGKEEGHLLLSSKVRFKKVSRRSTIQCLLWNNLDTSIKNQQLRSFSGLHSGLGDQYLQTCNDTLRLKPFTLLGNSCVAYRLFSKHASLLIFTTVVSLHLQGNIDTICTTMCLLVITMLLAKPLRQNVRLHILGD